MAGKLPYISLFVGDWMKDQVSTCSLAAQGLWLRMMFLGHDSERYGYLSLNGAAMPPGHIARRCNTTLDQYTTLLAELDEAGVPSRTPEGIIFSRRMAKDAQTRALGAKRQRRKRKRDKKLSDDGCHADVTPDVTPQSEDANEDENAIEKRSDFPQGKSARKSASKKFVAPTVEEVRAFCIERGNGIDADRFVNHYAARGWKSHGSAIVNWKACVVTWERRNAADSNGLFEPSPGIQQFRKAHRQ